MKIIKLPAAFCLLLGFAFCACNKAVSVDKVSYAKDISPIQTQPTAQPKLNLTDETVEIVRLVIDLLKLQQYYHGDIFANRKPLYILKNDVMSEDLQLSKFDEPVRFADCDELKLNGKPYLEFRVLDTKEEAANVVFRYRREEVEGRLTLRKNHNQWQVQKEELVEAKFKDSGCTLNKSKQKSKGNK